MGWWIGTNHYVRNPILLKEDNEENILKMDRDEPIWSQSYPLKEDNEENLMKMKRIWR